MVGGGGGGGGWGGVIDKNKFDLPWECMEKYQMAETINAVNTTNIPYWIE